MSAWIEGDKEEKIKDIDRKFEDDFAPQNNKSFQKLEDSDDYLKLLESRLRKIKKDPSVLKQLKEKREECFNNLLNNSLSITSQQDFELDESLQSNEIIRHLVPAQAQTVGEIAHLIRHDTLDQQKQEEEAEANHEDPATGN